MSTASAIAHPKGMYI